MVYKGVYQVPPFYDKLR